VFQVQLVVLVAVLLVVPQRVHHLLAHNPK